MSNIDQDTLFTDKCGVGSQGRIQGRCVCVWGGGGGGGPGGH